MDAQRELGRSGILGDGRRAGGGSRAAGPAGLEAGGAARTGGVLSALLEDALRRARAPVPVGFPTIATWGGRSGFAEIWDRTLPFQNRLLRPFRVRVALHPQDLSGSARRCMENVLATLL
jgi:hypothetical protein